MSLQRVAFRYAKSLIEMAQEQNKLEKVKEDIDDFLQALKNRDFELLLKSPVVKEDKKSSIFKAIFEGKMDELTLRFFDIVLRKHRSDVLPEIAKEFVHQYKGIKHITEVKVTSAVPLSEDLLEAIQQKLKSSGLTDENIEIQTEINPNLIGGFVLQFEDKMYDASIAYKLAQLKDDFDDNLYISQIVA